MATNEQMKIEFALFSDVWKLFKKFYEPQADDAYWTVLAEEAAAIVQHYDSCPLCLALLTAVQDELMRKSRSTGEMRCGKH